VGQLDLQRGAAAHREAVLAGDSVPVFVRLSEEPRRFFAGIERLFVPDRRHGHRESSARDPNNLRLDRSLSAFSIPQIAQLSFVYQLPFGRHGNTANAMVSDALLGGWQVNGIYRVDNGLPIQLGLCGGCSVNLPTYGTNIRTCWRPCGWPEPAI
jgi:hypothetical protein